MVLNITKEKIAERMAVLIEEAWSVRGVKAPPKRGKPPTSELTPYILEGRWGVRDAYEVIEPPIGATVPYLPEEASEQSIGGKTYYVYDGTYYKPFVSNGETIYMVVDDPRSWNIRAIAAQRDT
jgi:hypothetical protein